MEVGGAEVFSSSSMVTTISVTLDLWLIFGPTFVPCQGGLNMNNMLILSMARTTIDNHDDDGNKHTQCRMSEERGL